jgi:hypothetical protein
MQRREFLKLSGLFSAAFFTQLNVARISTRPIEAEAQGRIYRAAPHGKIFVSADSGKSWQLHTNFGTEMIITDLTPDDRGQIHAQLGFAGHSFELVLAPNGKTWRAM